MADLIKYGSKENNQESNKKHWMGELKKEKHESHESRAQEKKEHMAKKIKILKPEKKEHGMFKENGERYK